MTSPWWWLRSWEIAWDALPVSLHLISIVWLLKHFLAFGLYDHGFLCQMLSTVLHFLTKRFLPIHTLFPFSSPLCDLLLETWVWNLVFPLLLIKASLFAPVSLFPSMVKCRWSYFSHSVSARIKCEGISENALHGPDTKWGSVYVPAFLPLSTAPSSFCTLQISTTGVFSWFHKTSLSIRPGSFVCFSMFLRHIWKGFL